MDEGQPVTIEEVSKIIVSDAKDGDAQQLAAFDQYRVEAFSAPIVRYRQTERVVVAWHGTAIRSSTTKTWKMGSMSHRSILTDEFLSTGAIPKNCGSHFNAWIEGRGLGRRCGSAVPVD